MKRLLLGVIVLLFTACSNGTSNVLPAPDAARGVPSEALRLIRHPSGESVFYNFTTVSNTPANPIGDLYYSGDTDTIYGTSGITGRGTAGAVFQVASPESSPVYSKLLNLGLYSDPQDGVIRSSSSPVALFLTTEWGGTGADCGGLGSGSGCGTIDELTKNGSGVWSQSVLYSFGVGTQANGENPTGRLAIHSGNIFGTTCDGGEQMGDEGVVFEIGKDGSGFTVLHRMPDTSNDICPADGVLTNSNGDLFGVSAGAIAGTISKEVPGTVWEETYSSGSYTFSDLYTFGGTAGENPTGPPIADSAGNLYGTTVAGGDLSCTASGFPGCGVIWQLSKGVLGWNETVLHKFTGFVLSYGSLALSGSTLYGTASAQGGPSGCGFLFSINTDGTSYTDLHDFAGGTSDGCGPVGGVAIDPDGDIWGTTYAGGTHNQGTIWEYVPAASLHRHSKVRK